MLNAWEFACLAIDIQWLNGKILCVNRRALWVCNENANHDFVVRIQLRAIWNHRVRFIAFACFYFYLLKFSSRDSNVRVFVSFNAWLRCSILVFTLISFFAIARSFTSTSKYCLVWKVLPKSLEYIWKFLKQKEILTTTTIIFFMQY